MKIKMLLLSIQQAQRLRTGHLDPLDVSNSIDEIEDLGQSQIWKLENWTNDAAATCVAATLPSV